MVKKENPPANAGDIRDADLIPGSGISPGGGHGNPWQLQCSGLENATDRGTCRATVYSVSKSRTRLKVTRHTHMHNIKTMLNILLILRGDSEGAVGYCTARGCPYAYQLFREH